jgi:hypothetical protein
LFNNVISDDRPFLPTFSSTAPLLNSYPPVSSRSSLWKNGVRVELASLPFNTRGARPPPKYVGHESRHRRFHHVFPPASFRQILSAGRQENGGREYWSGRTTTARVKTLEHGHLFPVNKILFFAWRGTRVLVPTPCVLQQGTFRMAGKSGGGSL